MLFSTLTLSLSVLATTSANQIWRPTYPAYSPPDGRSTCTVRALGNQQDDSPNILRAFKDCGNNGHIIFPAGEKYTVASVINVQLNDVVIDWMGEWQLAPNKSYWANNSIPIAFQNHVAGIVFGGKDIQIDGWSIGGINGTGNYWYTADQGITSPGRPMPFVWWNASDVTVKNFYVVDPPLWAINLMNVTNAWFDNIYVNATSPEQPAGKNWVVNADGFDTLDSNNIILSNFLYKGGDDCVAIKPRSYNVELLNITCHDGNNIAIGSVGQYLEDSSVYNIRADNVTAYNTEFGAYIKTWVGKLLPQPSYESAFQPRGAGWGNVRNILFSNFKLVGAQLATAITQDSGDNGTFPGTSLMTVSNVAFVNFTGYVNTTGAANTSVVNDISCSGINPCYGITYDNFNVSNLNSKTEITTCQYTRAGGVFGVNCTQGQSGCPLGACGQAVAGGGPTPMKRGLGFLQKGYKHEQ